MPDEEFNFAFLITFDREVPEWAWEKVGLYEGIITKAAIDVLAGPAQPRQTPQERFDLIAGAAKVIAAEKMRKSKGTLPEPVVVSVDDLP